MQETFMSDSEEEGGKDLCVNFPSVGLHSFSESSVLLMKVGQLYLFLLLLLWNNLNLDCLKDWSIHKFYTSMLST